MTNIYVTYIIQNEEQNHIWNGVTVLFDFFYK